MEFGSVEIEDVALARGGAATVLATAILGVLGKRPL
jgi:hypothetical protein